MEKTRATTIKGLPLLGNLLEFRRDRLGLQRRLVAECGDAGRFRLGPVPVLMLASPQLAHELLVDHAFHFIKSAGLREFGRPLLGRGLLTAEGDDWKRQRRLLAPAFQHKRIAAYAEVMAGLAERAQAALADGAVVDVAEEMMKLTLAIVGRTLFDADVSSDAAVVGEALTDAMQYMVDSVSTVPLPYSWPVPRNLRMRRAVRRLDEVVYRIIRERRAESRDRGDVLSMLLAARDEDDGRGMDDRQLRDEVMTLVLAGHETTANALSWTFYLLARHPAAYDRVQAELDGALAGRTPQMADLARLPWSLAVLKESMRLYPPAYLMSREAIRDVELGGMPVKRGTIVMVNTFGMHHRADLFPEPDAFRPERFLGDAEKSVPKSAYLPFGGGPRVCIGNHFAMMEAHLLLATLAQRVRLHAAFDGERAAEPLVTLRPKDGLPMRVQRRQAAAVAA